jgi:hypothetical protein
MKPKANGISDINIAGSVGKIKIEYNAFCKKKTESEITECIQLANIKRLHEVPVGIKADITLPFHNLQTFQKGSGNYKCCIHSTCIPTL